MCVLCAVYDVSVLFFLFFGVLALATEEAQRRSELPRKKLTEEANCHGRSSMTKRNAMEEAQRKAMEEPQ
jgi:uncharacterized MAPEG superfamily protein